MSGLSDRVDDPLKWLQAVLDLLPFPAHLIELGTGRILFANRSAARLPMAIADSGVDGASGVVATDEAGREIPPEQMPHRRAARGEPLEGVQVSWRIPEGEATFLVFSGTVPAMLGHPSVTVLTLLEITRLKAAEAELRRAIAARDEFFSFATHELKDPLTALLLSIEALKRLAEKPGGIPAPLLAQQLEISKRQGDRLAWMIGNLLDVSRIAGGRTQLDVETLDLCELLHELAVRFGPQARSAGSAIVVTPCAPTIGYFDRLKVEHAIGNLISNAIKYGGGRPVTVRLEADATTVRIAVEDQGEGIAEADHGRIFERFERASGDHKRQSLGLGLFIVRSMVEAHGGSVRLRSEPGRGSSFTVELPRRHLPRCDAAPTPDAT